MSNVVSGGDGARQIAKWTQEGEFPPATDRSTAKFLLTSLYDFTTGREIMQGSSLKLA